MSVASGPASISSSVPTLARIDGQPINLATPHDVIARLRQFARAGRGFSLFTLNLDHLVKRRSDPAFRAAYSRATFVTADGAPVVALARSQGARLTRTTGADLVVPVCALAELEGLPVFFFGSTEVVLQGAARNLLQRFPALKVSGMLAPAFGFDPLSDAAIIAADRIAASGSRFCFVALGAPKQELFVDAVRAKHPEIGFLCVGAALDFIAGGQKRAPKWMQDAKVEWLWRLLTNPRRLATRYARCAWLLAELLVRAPAIEKQASR